MFVETLAKSQKPIETLMMLLVVILISTFLIKFFWNRGLVPFVSVLRPLKNLQEALMLSIGLAIIRGC
jgi:hypothetical protein|tara:strand:- start:243 stop:446 length:204 start_codon:yes stop_codon:yes gene_type:complete